MKVAWEMKMNDREKIIAFMQFKQDLLAPMVKTWWDEYEKDKSTPSPKQRKILMGIYKQSLGNKPPVYFNEEDAAEIKAMNNWQIHGITGVFKAIIQPYAVQSIKESQWNENDSAHCPFCIGNSIGHNGYFRTNHTKCSNCNYGKRHGFCTHCKVIETYRGGMKWNGERLSHYKAVKMAANFYHQSNNSLTICLNLGIKRRRLDDKLKELFGGK